MDAATDFGKLWTKKQPTNGQDSADLIACIVASFAVLLVLRIFRHAFGVCYNTPLCFVENTSLLTDGFFYSPLAFPKRWSWLFSPHCFPVKTVKAVTKSQICSAGNFYCKRRKNYPEKKEITFYSSGYLVFMVTFCHGYMRWRWISVRNLLKKDGHSTAFTWTSLSFTCEEEEYLKSPFKEENLLSNKKRNWVVHFDSQGEIHSSSSTSLQFLYCCGKIRCPRHASLSWRWGASDVW